MIRKCKKGIEWLEFHLLQPYKVKHGVFLRSGGASSGPFSSLNFSGAGGDVKEDVFENRRLLREVVELDHLSFVNQVHGKEVVIVERGHLEPPSADGMITREKGVGLCVQHADCQATLLYDPLHHVIAAVHAGWRGNVLNIYKSAVDKLQTQFGTNPKDLIACISPSLGPSHAEFIHYQNEFPSSFWKFQVKPNYFNLWEIARFQLEEIGVLKGHIEIASLCTYATPNDFFSFRRDKVTGRNVTLAALV